MTTSKNFGEMQQSLRTRYFPRQVVTAEDLTTDQKYFLERLRRHNRLMHGSGVVWGLEVLKTSNPKVVRVTAGYSLSPQGDEILIPHDRLILQNQQGEWIDVETTAIPTTASKRSLTTIDTGRVNPNISDSLTDASSSLSRPVDSWSTGSSTAYLAIRYDETAVRPISTLAERSGAGTTCEPCRYQAGWKFACLNEPPKALKLWNDDPLEQKKQIQKVLDYLLNPQPLAVSDPVFPLLAYRSEPEERWIALAKLTFDSKGNITNIDYTMRAQIFPTQLLVEILRRLPQTLPSPTISGFEPKNGSVGTAVTIRGTNFTGTTAVRFNGVVAATPVNVNPTGTEIKTNVPDTAISGIITITAPNGTAYSQENFTIPPLPIIYSITPHSAVSGETVIITGTNFMIGGRSVESVLFGNRLTIEGDIRERDSGTAKAVFSSMNNTALKVKVPEMPDEFTGNDEFTWVQVVAGRPSNAHPGNFGLR
jgi:hypothetical protein